MARAGVLQGGGKRECRDGLETHPCVLIQSHVMSPGQTVDEPPSSMPGHVPGTFVDKVRACNAVSRYLVSDIRSK